MRPVEAAERARFRLLLPCRVVGRTDPFFDHRERVVGVFGDGVSDRVWLVDDAGDETHAVGFDGVDDAPGEGEIERVPLADDAGESNGATPGTEQAEPDAWLAEGGRWRRDPKVAGESEFDATAAGRPVDAGDDDRLALFYRPGDTLSLSGERFGVVEPCDRVEVGTGAEARPGPVEIDDRLGGVDSGFERVEVGRTEGVAGRWAVERDRADGTVLGRLNHTVGCHSVSKGLCPCRRYLRPMDDAARARDAAREALADIEPPRLRDALYERLDEASMAPAVFTLYCARAVGQRTDVDAIVERTAGVQLIYEGLRLTRTLAHDEPWRTTDIDGDIDADLEMLAASVLVSRGFYLLARTAAASQAVETVRTFGRDQTRRREPGADTAALDDNLEASVFALASIAGATAVDSEAPPALVEYAKSLGRGADGTLPPAAVALGETTTEQLAALAKPGDGDGDRVPSSATDS